MRKSQDLILKPMSPDRFPETCQVVQEGLSAGVAPGIVAGVWRFQNPDEIYVIAQGSSRKIPSEQPISVHTVFDLASVSKVMGTGALMSVLVERRWLNWDTPLRSILPEFSSDQVNLSHLLTHTAGLVAWEPFWEKLREEFSRGLLHEIPVEIRQAAMRRLVLSQVPQVPPEERCIYSDVSFLLLGFALEAVTQMPLDRAVKELVWNPMGLSSAFYRRVTQDVHSGRLDFVAATENCPWRGGVLQGQVHDDNCWAMGGYAGHAGAFASIRDVLHFARALMSGFLSDRTLRESWTSSKLGRAWGGWDCPSESGSSAGSFFSKSSVGHLGFTGTSLWIDPTAQLAVSLLTNRVHPSRDPILIREFRPRFHDALRKDIAAGA